MQECQVNFLPNFKFPCFDPNEKWSLWQCQDLKPGPLGHEPSALTTRPRLLAYQQYFNLYFSVNQIHIQFKVLFTNFELLWVQLNIELQKDIFSNTYDSNELINSNIKKWVYRLFLSLCPFLSLSLSISLYLSLSHFLSLSLSLN